MDRKKIGRVYTQCVFSCCYWNMQISHIFDTLDLDHNGSISWEEFSNFLQRNPEYLAVIMAARPNLLKAPEEP